MATSHMHHFNVYDLSNDFVIKLSIIFNVIILAFFFTTKMYITTKKKLAWSISLLNSIVMSIGGILYMHAKIVSVGLPKVTINLFSQLPIVQFTPDGNALFHSIDNVSVVLCVWFACANINDIVLGIIFYRGQLGFLTAYVHHTLYLWIMLACTTKNGLFISTNYFASAFALMLTEEIPTALLAVGSMSSALRSDIAFGTTFFIFRLVFHGLMFLYAVCSKTDIVLRTLFFITLCMHVNWFWTWCNKYLSKAIKSASDTGKGILASAPFLEGKQKK